MTYQGKMTTVWLQYIENRYKLVIPQAVAFLNSGHTRFSDLAVIFAGVAMHQDIPVQHIEALAEIVSRKRQEGSGPCAHKPYSKR